MTPAEIYAVNFQNPEPKYYARIPHIINYLTYDHVDKETGQTTVKRLSVNAAHLYNVLKSIARDYGVCWQNRDDLAELANMSTGAITNAKKELENKFHQLDGNPLIKIEEVKKTTDKNGTIYHRIMIIDIWRWNNAFMSTLKFHKNQAPSPNDGAETAPSPNDTALEGAPSPGDTNNNTVNKNKLLKEQQYTAKADSVVSCCSSNTACSSVPSEASDVLEEKAKSLNWFLKIGCDIVTATQFVKTYSLEDIKKASLYVDQQIKLKRAKNQEITNIIGYLRKTLENKWWLKKNE